jgi:hypothetical protein
MQHDKQLDRTQSASKRRLSKVPLLYDDNRKTSPSKMFQQVEQLERKVAVLSKITET